MKPYDSSHPDIMESLSFILIPNYPIFRPSPVEFQFSLSSSHRNNITMEKELTALEWEYLGGRREETGRAGESLLIM